ncbi:MAG: 4-alpha-glucanotransferase [Chloroflexi bacterium]|nr:4-alpha-glucanotransferase [Chloroflexota bacterium]
MELEGGGTRHWRFSTSGLSPFRPIDPAEASLPGALLAAPLPSDLPVGYHQLHVRGRDIAGACALIVAPTRAFEADSEHRKGWGIFLPLYALVTGRTRGLADYSDLGSLLSWAKAAGCDAVGTLPMLPTFLNEPFDPSPYAPVSRLFWNELYIDPRATPEFASCVGARVVLEKNGKDLLRLNRERLVDYRSAWALKRPVLAALAACSLESEESRGLNAKFSEENAEVDRYAAFRAAGDRLKKGWQKWPERMRRGEIRPDDYRDVDAQLYLYAQRVADEQVKRAGESGSGLYLDLPVGVHSAGFDAWRNQRLFALDASAGAPPDVFFSSGQNWGFAPLVPDQLEADCYSYLRGVFRHHMKATRMLRVDHVMGFHRMFVIPAGARARDGVYVRYRAEEIYAVLALESQRYGTVVVGEDLGTVPSYVGAAMRRHGVKRMYCTYFRVRPRDPQPFPPPGSDSVAFLNTHDMPTFAAWWTGADTDQRLKLGIVTAAHARKERSEKAAIRRAAISYLRGRGCLGTGDAGGAGDAGGTGDAGGAGDSEDTGHAETSEVLRALLRFLADSPAAFVLVNLEDLWLEPSPQNVPGTTTQHPNWRHRAAHPLEEWSERPGLVETLADIRQLRTR